MKMKSRTYMVSWLCAGDDGTTARYEEVDATTVPRALSKLKKSLVDAGYEWRDVRVIECTAKDR